MDEPNQYDTTPKRHGTPGGGEPQFRAEDALRQSDRAKDEFLATLAHELRNPLAPLRNAAYLLRLHKPESPECQWALGVIERQTQQMTRLIDDLLDVSRLTRNQIELRVQRVDLADVLRAAVETSRPVIDAAGHELVISPPTEPLFLNADITRLSQALSNLLNNAAKYTEKKGRIWLSAQREDALVSITVRDSGLGIPREMLPQVFDMFTQISRVLNRPQGGLGIGLSLVKRLVELHGGSVEARSEGAGQGSEFIVRLPMMMETMEQPPGTELDVGQVGTGASLRILIADDNRDSADSLAMLLRMTGNEVHAVYNGADAVTAVRESVPDVALLDIGMPEMSGYQAARKIRQQPGGDGIVLIALTGWGQESDRRRAKAAGFDQHLVKPINPANLLDLLASIPRSVGEAVNSRH